MKDQYFGDINDFRKYCILSKLTKLTRLPICFVWMRTSADGRPDGKKTRYLGDPEKWWPLNPALFDFLRRHVLELEERKIAVFRKAPGFPKAKFIEHILTESPAEQDAYFAQVRHIAGRKDVLFFDPDNGLEVDSVKVGRAKSPKHLYWRDLRPLYGAGHSVIIYQHFPREKRVPYTKRKLKEVDAYLKGATAFAIRTPHVLFLMATQPGDAKRIGNVLARTFKRDQRLLSNNTFEFYKELLTGQ
jgi:hypothetical protein